MQQRLAHTSAQGVQQQYVRFLPGAVRPTTVEQFEILQRQNQLQQQNRIVDPGTGPRLPVNQGGVIQRPALVQPAAPASTSAQEASVSEEGIPDNVTAELEKLEQESGTRNFFFIFDVIIKIKCVQCGTIISNESETVTKTVFFSGTMVEFQGVTDILGGLGDDDDELLAEMGADFNILEYADPELETLTGGKTNILDLELEEEPIKKDNKVGAPPTTTTQSTTTTKATTGVKREVPLVAKSTPEAVENLTQPPSTTTNQAPPVAQHPPLPPPAQQTAQPMPPQHLTAQQIHQQMMHQVISWGKCLGLWMFY